MKRAFSLLLSALLVALMIVPSLAAGDAKTTFELSDIIENYEPHTEEELAKFKSELPDGMFAMLMSPVENFNIFLVSNGDRLPKREDRRLGRTDLFVRDDVVMGIKKDNGFVELPYAEEKQPHPINTYEYAADGSAKLISTKYTRVVDGALYGSEEGLFCAVHIFDSARAFLNTLSSKEKEEFILNFYLSVLETDEAIGLVAYNVYYAHEDSVTPDVKNDDGAIALENIIDGYKEHTAAELSAFKTELKENDMYWELMYPSSRNVIYLISNREELRTVKRGDFDLFGEDETIMGIKKNNGFVNLLNSEKYEKLPFLTAYGEEAGQYCRLDFSETAVKYLASLPASERESFMLNLYLSVMETEEAVGITFDKRYGADMGDVNGDGKINAVDANALIGFLTDKSSAIIPESCDFDNNGSINFRDNFYLKTLIIAG